MKPVVIIGRRVLALTLLAGLLLSAGCKTTDPAASNRFAAVTIKNRSFKEIEMAVAAVFQKHGYQRSPVPGITMVFEQQGSRLNTLAYAGLSRKPVWMRVKVDIRITSPESRVIECNVFRVVDRGDATMEEESRVLKINRGPYQELLKEIQAVLNPPPQP